MYRTSLAAGWMGIAMLLLPAVAAAQGDGGRRPGGRIYQEHDRVTDARFTATTDALGHAVLAIRGGDFTHEKVVAPSGDATIRLTQGKDVVTIAISAGGYEVARGRRAIRFDPRSGAADKLDAIRSLLIGSQAVRSFKRLAAALENRDESEEDGVLALSALVDGALVQLLDGDPDAPKRIAKRIVRRQRAALRTVAARLPGPFTDCVGLYQVALLSAYTQVEGCYAEAKEYSWWSRDFVYFLCDSEWLIRSQQYIWQFIGCFMFPW